MQGFLSRAKQGIGQMEQGGGFRVQGLGCAGLSGQGLARLAKLWQGLAGHRPDGAACKVGGLGLKVCGAF